MRILKSLGQLTISQSQCCFEPGRLDYQGATFCLKFDLIRLEMFLMSKHLLMMIPSMDELFHQFDWLTSCLLFIVEINRNSLQFEVIDNFTKKTMMKRDTQATKLWKLYRRSRKSNLHIAFCNKQLMVKLLNETTSCQSIQWNKQISEKAIKKVVRNYRSNFSMRHSLCTFPSSKCFAGNFQFLPLFSNPKLSEVKIK